MPLPIEEYYNNKSILKTFNFSVIIVHDDSGNHTYLPNGEKIPKIEDIHILDVEIPQWEFKKEVVQYGPYKRTFPVLNHDGFEFTITFEEDTNGTISRFINYLQRKIILNDGSGRYVAPKISRLDNIIIDVENDKKEVVMRFDFKECYYLKSSTLNFNYNSNDSVKYQITFNCDFPIIQMSEEFGTPRLDPLNTSFQFPRSGLA